MRKQQHRFRAHATADPKELERRRDYYLRPEVQAKYKARNGTEKHKAYMREYRARPETKARQKEHSRLLKCFPIGMYDKLMEAQAGLCAICQRTLTPEKARTVHCDHDHATKTPRGVLCNNCNNAEGNIRRCGLSPHEFGERLAAYLANPPAAQFLTEDAHDD